MKHAAALCIALLSGALLLLAGCARQGDPQAGPGRPVYRAEEMAYEIGCESWENLFAYDVSPNGRYVIYVASHLNRNPEAYLYDGRTGTHTRLTDNGYFIEANAHVDDQGNWALMLSETSVSQSKVLYNGETISQNGGWNHGITLVNGQVFYASYDASRKTTDLCCYDPQSRETTVLCSGLSICLGETACLDDTAILAEVTDLRTAASYVAEITVAGEAAGKVEPVTDGTGNSFLKPGGDPPTVVQVDGDDNAMYLWNAYYWIWHYQTLEPWSGSTDSAGRISWNASYRLLGEVELWRKTRDPALKERIQYAVHRLLAARQAAREESPQKEDFFLFVTQKYSINQEDPLTLMADNGMIYWAMMEAYNEGCVAGEDRESLLSMARQVYTYYEPDWDASIQGYRFRRGIPFWADGVMLPFNQQNVFGLFLLELWKATGDEVYLQRADALARSFAGEMELTEDGAAVWHYWPMTFYAGWSASDDISDNTPEHPAVEEIGYEDASHAGLNARFVLSYTDARGFDVFTEEMVQGIYLTADRLVGKGTVSSCLYPIDQNGTFLNGLWANAMTRSDGGAAFAEHARLTCNYSFAEFDNQSSLYKFAAPLDMTRGGTLTAQFSTPDGKGGWDTRTEPLGLEDIPALAMEFSPVPVTASPA